jgi:hypothetical protein
MTTKIKFDSSRKSFTPKGETMKSVRTPMQILEEVAALYKAAPRIPELAQELRTNCPAIAGCTPDRVVEIIRARLAAHGVGQQNIDRFVIMYLGEAHQVPMAEFEQEELNATQG